MQPPILFPSWHSSSRFNTASGRYCCNANPLAKGDYDEDEVSIPQAVGTVATAEFFLMSGSYAGVSIPQAVGTVATLDVLKDVQRIYEVSIPQAVGTVATGLLMPFVATMYMFQYRKR